MRWFSFVCGAACGVTVTALLVVIAHRLDRRIK